MDPKFITIDDKKRLSDTVLWQLQRAYYERNAVKCWQECVVPNFITSNGFIAQAYARIIAGFLRDYLGPSPSGDDDEEEKKEEEEKVEENQEKKERNGADAKGSKGNRGAAAELPAVASAGAAAAGNGFHVAAAAGVPSDGNARHRRGSSEDTSKSRQQEQEPEPVYIIELGAGSAKLSYVLVKKLLRLAQFLPPMGAGQATHQSQGGGDTRRRDSNGSARGGGGSGGHGGSRASDGDKEKEPKVCFKYVITDFSGANFDFWLNHPRFQPLLEAGVLDVGTFDAESGGIIRLAVSGVELRPGKLVHPVVVVANYVFDSLKHDAFRVSGGRLEEVLCTTTVAEGSSVAAAAAAAADADAPLENPNPDLLRYLKCAWSHRACDAARSYPRQRRWCDVLAALCEGQTDASFLMPVGALQALEHTRALCRDGRMLLLSGDKGYASARELAGVRDPHVAMHGSFSCMVNFRALQLYAEQEVGFAEHGGRLEGFKCCLLGLGISQEELPQARLAFRHGVVSCGHPSGGSSGGFGPDSFSSLQRCLKEEAAPRGLSLRTVLAVLRLSHFDSDVFYKFKQAS